MRVCLCVYALVRILWYSLKGSQFLLPSFLFYLFNTFRASDESRAAAAAMMMRFLSALLVSSLLYSVCNSQCAVAAAAASLASSDTHRKRAGRARFMFFLSLQLARTDEPPTKHPHTNCRAHTQNTLLFFFIIHFGYTLCVFFLSFFLLSFILNFIQSFFLSI